MYAKVLNCYKLSDGQWIAELKLDQPGLKVNTVLSSQVKDRRWTVLNRVVYAQFRTVHKTFPFEKLKVIRLNIQDKDLDKLKMDLCKREDSGVFQYIIKSVSHKQSPQLNEELLCADY